jgi:ubiquinone/menaquinone biosynthesis C-methylase UbiE
MGLDLGYAGDPITPWSITLDLPTPYQHSGNHPQNLSGDACSLYWFKDGVLDYVYSSHLVEDFTYLQLPSILRDWLRVIKIGGFLVTLACDQPAFIAHCAKTSQGLNLAHKESDFSLETFLPILLGSAPENTLKIIHAIPIVDNYSFEVVVCKIR